MIPAGGETGASGDNGPMTHPPGAPPGPSISEAIAANVRRRRVVAGFSLAELAERAGTSKGTVAAVESGSANPTVDTVQALAGALACSLSDLLAGSSDPMLVHERDTGEREIFGVLEGRLLHRFSPTGSVEFFDLHLPAGRRLESAPHPDGVYEHIWVASGLVIAGPDEDPQELHPGDYLCFAGWRRHHYLAPEGRAHLFMALSLKRALSSEPPLHHLG